jgi:hypothetical protein
VNAWTALVACAGLYLLGYWGLIFERWCIRREARTAPAEPGQKPWTEPRPGPDRTPEPSPLTLSEEAWLAALACRYRDDPQAGWKLGGWLRERLPGVPDIEIMRCVRALMNVARTFARNEPDAAVALDRFLHQCGAAALDLSSLERQDIEKT